MKVKRLKEMSQLERAQILRLWNYLQKAPVYNGLRPYSHEFEYEGKAYVFSCNYQVIENHLHMENIRLEHKQEVIDIMH